MIPCMHAYTCMHMQVEEVKHYMVGLANVHSPKKGVIWRINLAYDVLYNEVYIIIVKPHEIFL